MIPKKIHYTWFSNDPFPAVVKHCMDTWEDKLQGYEFVHWDMRRISTIDNIFLQQAISVKKWAFAADFVRMYALYTEGGIYLDTDVEVYKSFEDLLQYKAFIGKERFYHVSHRRAVKYLTSHCMGAEARHPFFKLCMDYYKNRPFILSEEEWLPDTLKYDQTILPFIQMEIAKLYGYHPSDRVKGIQTLKDGVNVYPAEYFDARYKTKISYCSHKAMGGWINRKENPNHAKDRIMKGIDFSLSHLLKKMGIVVFKRL